MKSILTELGVNFIFGISVYFTLYFLFNACHEADLWISEYAVDVDQVL